MKSCTKCLAAKPADEFYVDKVGCQQTRCRDCVRAASRAYYAKSLRAAHDTGELTLQCQECNKQFTYLKTTGPRRKYCGERCKAQAGEAKRLEREATRVRRCRVCRTSENVTRVGKPICKGCRKEDRNNTETNRRRRLNMYGLTSAQFDEMVALQRGQCAICATDDPGTRGWQIDHDHACCPGIGSCGACVRGLLCHHCNVLLGNAKDSVDRLRQAEKYLLSNAQFGLRLVK